MICDFSFVQGATGPRGQKGEAGLQGSLVRKENTDSGFKIKTEPSHAAVAIYI